MKSCPLFLALFLACFLQAAGQTVAPKPSPTPPDEGDVVKISTNLIQIDISVTDKDGKLIRDLRPDEIEVYQNGKKQAITNFSFISSARDPLAAQKPITVLPGGVPVPPVVTRPENIRRTIALVVDDLNLSFESTSHVRLALKKFVDEQMQDGDLVAIIRTGAGIGALQQFTTDKRLLYAAIEKVKWNPVGNGLISAFAPLEAKPSDGDADSTPTPTPDMSERTQEGFEREFNDFRTNLFATGSLGAVNYVVGGMANLPGRKSIMLLSDGFKMFNVDAGGFSEASPVREAIRVLADKANRSSVVIYTMDPRGLVVTGITAADNTEGRNPEELQTAESDRRAELSDTQDGLRYLARETGGFAIVNSNDLSGGIRRILDDQNYYLVAYIPDDETFDPKKQQFNKLVVKVTRKGASVRYRSGFFNVADKPVEKVTAGATAVNQLETALTSPFAFGGISLRLNALFGNDLKSGSFVRSLLHIDTSDLKFTDEKDGIKKATFDVLAMSFGDNGQVVDQLAKSYTLTIKPENLPKLMANGVLYNFSFPVKKAGAYQYRIALRDSQSGKVGSASQFIEVPDLKKNGLTTSSIIIDSLTEDEWQRFIDPNAERMLTNPLSDTALRRVKIGSVLRYGYEVYNAKLGPTKLPAFTTKTRVFRDGKVILDGKQSPVELRGQTEMQHLRVTGALSIGTKMPPGDYILQIVVTDPLAKANHQIATQFVQFEIVE